MDEKNEFKGNELDTKENVEAVKVSNDEQGKSVSKIYAALPSSSRLILTKDSLVAIDSDLHSILKKPFALHANSANQNFATTLAKHFTGTLTRARAKKMTNKKVRFDNVEVREYARTLGETPANVRKQTGAITPYSLSLDWHVVRRSEYTIDAYEEMIVSKPKKRIASCKSESSSRVANAKDRCLLLWNGMHPSNLASMVATQRGHTTERAKKRMEHKLEQFLFSDKVVKPS
jgi:hypothetical protein